MNPSGNPSEEENLTPSKTPSALLSDVTTEELLDHLARHSRREGPGFLITICGLAFAMMFTLMPFVNNNIPLGIFAMIASTLMLGLAGGALQKWRTQRIHLLVSELAGRGEKRAIAPLIEIHRWLTISLKSRERRFIADALMTLMAQFTPEEFRDLNQSEVSHLSQLAIGDYSHLREPAIALLERCGDVRALRVLLAPGNRRVGPPLPKATKAKLDVCLNTLRERVETEARLASLLRPADANGSLAAQELLRAADVGSATPPDQLLRPGRVSYTPPTPATTQTQPEPRQIIQKS